MTLASSNEPWRAEPATDRQKKKLRFYGVHIKRGLTKGEASDLIEAAMEAHPELEVAYEAAKEDEEALWLLEEMINDEETREIGHYKKLTKAQLKSMLSYLLEHVPNWQETSRFDLCELVPRLFPDQRKVSGERAVSVRQAGRSRGCLVLLVVPVSVGFVVFCLV